MNLKSLLVGAAGGAALVYFLDPDAGNRRRSIARDRTTATFRRGASKGSRAATAVSSQAYGVTQKVAHLKEEEKPQPDDVTLARKVESEIFRDADAPKGKVSVNAVNGVVTLRGELDDEDQIKDLEAATRKVQGVQDVENLLHTQGTPAPTSG
jgi:osmotically-inducible protein OsmY